MKKSIIAIVGDDRQTYETPSIKVCQIEVQFHLLTTSGEKKTLDIIDDSEEEWPIDPDTNQPLPPW